MNKINYGAFLVGFLQCMGVLLIPIGLSYTFPGVKRAFICQDPTLSLSQLPDTIPNWLLVVWAVSPMFVIFLCEMIFNLKKFKHDIFLCINLSWHNTSFLFHRYAVNICLMHLIMFTAKFFTGSHRPHFFETCKPDALLTCTPGTIVYDFKCTNTDARFYNILDASQSFFSGHAASCVYSCTFIAWYLQRKIRATNIFMLPFIQSLLLALAYFGAISRVFDHRHHVIDVVAGGIVGVLTTAHAWMCLCKDYEFKDGWNEQRRVENRNDVKILPRVSVITMPSESEGRD